MNEISPELLTRLLQYNQLSGVLVWKSRPIDMFSRHGGQKGNCNRWNKLFSGKRAFLTKSADGYLVGKVFGTTYFSHRVIWALVNKEWPEQIDHINGIRTDNRYINIRAVSSSDNARNQKIRSDNNSGVLGVGWSINKQKWRAFICGDKRDQHLGFFDNIFDAVCVRKSAEIHYGYHRNHGRKQ